MVGTGDLGPRLSLLWGRRRGVHGWPSLRSKAKSERRANERGVCKGRDRQRGAPSRVSVGEGSLSASEWLGMQMRCKAARGGVHGFWLSAQVLLRAWSRTQLREGAWSCVQRGGSGPW